MQRRAKRQLSALAGIGAAGADLTATVTETMHYTCENIATTVNMMPMAQSVLLFIAHP